jgi:cell division protein FtsB
MNLVHPASAAPFVGLRPFDRRDAELFFGRDREIAALKRKLHNARFTAVVGSSGSGKSSLVRAGVVPRLQADKWKYVIVKPGSAPLYRLATALAAAVDDDALTEARRFRFDSTLRASAFGLAEIAETLVPEASRLLLVIDQFEELFRYGEEASGTGRAAMREETRAFVGSLLAGTARKNGRLYVCVTMRSDFFGNCAAYTGLAEAVSESQFLVPYPLRGELEEAIRRPIEGAGGLIDEALAQRLLVDVKEESDPLPLLQHTLRRLWEGASGTPRKLEAEGYVAVGRIRGSIDRKAEAVMSVLAKANPTDCITIETIMKALTHLDDRERVTRRPQKRSELLALLKDTPGLLTRKGTPSLMVAQVSLDRVISAMSAEATSFLQLGEGDDPEIDIGHEALLRGWTRTAGQRHDFRTGWLREDLDAADRWRGYVRRAQEGPPLNRSEQKSLSTWLAKNHLSNAWAERYGNKWSEVLAFQRRSLRRTIYRFIVLLLSLLVVTAVGIVGYNGWREANREAVVLRSAKSQLQQENADLQARIEALTQENALLRTHGELPQAGLQQEGFFLWRAVQKFLAASPAAFALTAALGASVGAAITTLILQLFAARQGISAASQLSSRPRRAETAADRDQTFSQQLEHVQMEPSGLPHGGAYKAFPISPDAYRGEAWDMTLTALFGVAVTHAEDRIAWYDRAARRYSRSARLIRRGCLTLFILGTLAPIVATLLARLGPHLGYERDLAQLPFAEAGYVLLAIAGALVIFDQFFGYSSSWIRFRQSQAKLEVMLADLRFSWVALISAQDPDAESIQRTKCSVLLHDFIVTVERLAEAETREWATNFRSQIDAFDQSPQLSVKTMEVRRGASA